MRRTPRSPLFLLAMLVLAPALGGARGCDGDVDVGGDQDGGMSADAGGEYNPCAGLSCGASCSLCDPADTECVETAVEKMCQPDGSCGATVPECAGTYDPCEGLSCGARCTRCDPADTECSEPAVINFCQSDGTCQAMEAECAAPYDPCAGLACGQRCTRCDPADTECSEPAVINFCQPDGTCTSNEPTACEGPYDPCGGLACGASCTLCDPTDPECVETDVEKMCQPDGSCSASVPECASCSVTAQDLATRVEVNLEVGRLCDDLYLCLAAGDDGSDVEANSSFECSAADASSPCDAGRVSCILRTSVIDAAELADICAADGASGPGADFVCAVYL